MPYERYKFECCESGLGNIVTFRQFSVILMKIFHEARKTRAAKGKKDKEFMKV